jgi:hypothetical protein
MWDRFTMENKTTRHAVHAHKDKCCLTMNGMMERLSNRKWRELLGRPIFGLEEPEYTLRRVG